MTGKQNMEFRIYNVPTDGAPLWEEFWTGANSVDVSDGLFSVMLGSINTGLTAVVQGNTTLYLGITVGTDSEMAPRVQLGSVPFSIWSLTVANNSVTSAKIADNAVGSSEIAANAVGSSEIIDGAVTQAKAPGLIASTVNNMMIQHGSTPFFSDSCGDIQITFPQVFDQIPIVLISQREATAGYGDYIVFSVSKTGFSVSKTGSCITAGYVNWIAIGN